MSVAWTHEIVRLKNGVRSIRSTGEQETFHPVIGPAAEAEALYVNQLQLRERMRAEAEEFVIWDVGLGGAANPLTVLDRTRDAGRAVHILSFDRSLEPLEFALHHAGDLGYFAGLEAQVTALLQQGVVEFRQEQRLIRWELRLGDFPERVSNPAETLPPPHAVLFDAFSPARNPAMWTLPLFRALYRRLRDHRPCALPTYSRSTMLRVTLLLAGFHVGVGQAIGDKEETTIASNTPALLSQPLDRGWLKRAAASTSAEPLHVSSYRQAPLTRESLDQLLAHPQFRHLEPADFQIVKDAGAKRAIAATGGR